MTGLYEVLSQVPGWDDIRGNHFFGSDPLDNEFIPGNLGGFEPDGDFDGKDIAGFASQLSTGVAAMSLEEFANVFGK